MDPRRTSRRIPRPVAQIVLGAVLPAAILAGWHVAAQSGSAVVPPIGEVLGVLAHPFAEPENLDSAPLGIGATVSVLRVAIGFALAAATAIPIGLLLGRLQAVRDLLNPLISAVMVISPIAWMPVAIIAFGFASVGTVLYGEEAWRADILEQLTVAVIVVVWLGAFFPIALNASAGARGVREAHIEAVRMLGAGRVQILTKVVLPSAAPAIMTGMRVGVGIAWRVMVAAEFFPGTRSGLGHMIITAKDQTEYHYLYAAILVICAIGLILDGMLRLAHLGVSRWQRKERT
jgi:NitT/TauT family transport system permease protein